MSSGWNGSNTKDKTQAARPAVKPIKPTKPSALRGTLAGVIVVALVAAIWFFCFNDKEVAKPAKEGPAPSKTIAEVKPSIPKTKPAEPEKPKIDPNARPTRVGQVLNGYRLLPNGRMHKVKGVTTADPTQITLIGRTFKNSADQDIASILTTEPGSDIIGDSSEYYEDFNNDFREALKTPIVIDPKDSEYVKALKEGVLSTREELKKYLDEGKNLRDIMREARDQFRELALYREDLEHMIDQHLQEGKDELTTQDLKDLRAAANKMLEDRGINPLAINAMFDSQIRTIINERGEDDEDEPNE